VTRNWVSALVVGVIFGVAAALGNWATTYIYLMGWSPFRK